MKKPLPVKIVEAIGWVYVALASLPFVASVVSAAVFGRGALTAGHSWRHRGNDNPGVRGLIPEWNDACKCERNGDSGTGSVCAHGPERARPQRRAELGRSRCLHEFDSVCSGVVREMVGDRPRGTVVKGLFAGCWWLVWLISARLLRYNIPWI